MPFSLGDQRSRQLFLALCRRYGLTPYRLHRQRRTTVMLKTPKAFVDQVLWPEFQQLDEALRRYFSEVTTRIIRDEVHKDFSEAPESSSPSRYPPDRSNAHTPAAWLLNRSNAVALHDDPRRRPGH